MPHPYARHIFRSELLAPFCERLKRKEHSLILALGDSNTCNTTFTQGAKQWPELLHSELRDHFGTQAVLLVNSGVSGDCSKMVLERFETTALRFQPNLTILCLGPNDRRLTEAEFRANMTEIIERLQAAGSLVLLRTPTPIMEFKPEPKHLWRGDDDLRARIAIICELADRRGLPFVDTYAQWWAREESGFVPVGALMSDAVHTNALGHQEVCRGLLPAFGAPTEFAWESTAP